MEEAALRKLIRATLSLAFVAAFSLANTTNAASILSFGINAPGTKTATATTTGTGQTTITTNSASIPGSFPVSITTIGNVNLGPLQTINARETFGVPIGAGSTGITSVGAATLSGNQIQQNFSGTISYTDPSNAAINYLTITFTNAVLRGTAGGLSVELTGDNSVPGQTVTFTSTDPGNRVQPFLTDPVKTFTIGLTGLSAPLAITNGTIAPFTSANESGNASTAAVVPEPTSVVMAGTAVLVGLGCFKWRRSGTRSV